MPVIASNNFLEDLAFVLSVAAVVSVIFQALRQPVVGDNDFVLIEPISRDG